MIAAVDEFILYDDMQYTKNDWRNRNKIKTPNGVEWLTVPVGQNIKRKIRDVVLDNKWQVKHWKSIEANYRRAPYYEEISNWLKPIYLGESFDSLSSLNRRLIEIICNYLEIKTKITNSWDYILIDGQSERLANLCAQAGGAEYVSGPAARNYIEKQAFDNINIKLTWFDYIGYPEHPQLWGKFIHDVTILDLLFNCGKQSFRYMKFIK